MCLLYSVLGFPSLCGIGTEGRSNPGRVFSLDHPNHHQSGGCSAACMV